MPRDRPRDEDDEEEDEHFWKGLARDLLVAGIIVVVFLAAVYLYTGVWPPLVVVESSSMQHSDRESFLGVIDTGDMVFQQAAPTRADVVTYLEGRATGYATYGDYGDVIIFHPNGNLGAIPVIHRAILWARPNGTGYADVVDLLLLPRSDWAANNGSGLATHSPYHIQTAWIRSMGFNHDLNITFTFGSVNGFMRGPGYITMGDNNAYICRPGVPCSGGYDTTWFALQSHIIGRARGELPWFGLLKLTLQPATGCCSDGWGDTRAPKNSWDSLLVSLLFLLALPFILEFAMRGWTKYVTPRLPEIRWPWKRRTKPAATEGDPPNGEADPSDEEPEE